MPKRDKIALVIIEGREVVIYRTYQLDILVIDSKKTTKYNRYDFVIYNFDILDISLILGFF
jgi:hypothetical protein